jgi:O-6-methylguanine DNA methyltransferase
MTTFWQTPQYAALTPFQKAVLQITYGIPKGRVTTYGAIAAALATDGRGSSQAVGSALHANPFAPEVPCHRVVKSGTPPTLGGFMGSTPPSGPGGMDDCLRRKVALLQAEGVRFDARLRLSDPHAVLAAGELDERAVYRAQRCLGAIPPVKGWSDEPAVVVPPTLLPGEGASSAAAASGSAAYSTPSAVRSAARSGSLSGHTSGLAPGCAQANLVILPQAVAADFLLYCTRNPKPCPLLEVTAPGQAVLAHLPGGGGGEGGYLAPGSLSVAPGADLRTDLPRYCVWRDGVCIDSPTDISALWGGQAWVAFLLGCSFSFEEALLQAGLPVRHLQQEKGGAIVPALATHPRNVPMYRTSIPTAPAGPFAGPLVVSMRPMTPAQAQEAGRVTSRFPRVHGGPVHVGDPAAIGIADLSRPDYGDAVTLLPGEVPVFWACGVTPQSALARAKLPIAITHAPGHMLVLDVRNEQLAGEATVTVGGTGGAAAGVGSKRKRQG